MAPYTFNAVTVTASCAVFFGLYVLVTAAYNLFFHPLAKVPGPRLYAISNLPYINRLIRGEWPFVLKRLHDTYGPAVRFTPNDVSFASSSAWKDIYGHRKAGQLSLAKDKRLYRGSPGILVADDADHSRIRRLLSHAFSEKALRGQENIMKYHVDLLVTQLKKRASAGSTVDLVNWYNFTTFDLIGDLAFGESFGCLDSGGYHPWVAMIFGGFRLANYHQALKRLPRLAPFVSWLIPQKLVRQQREHMMLSFEKAKKRAEGEIPERPDFMSYILRHNDEKGMTPDEIGENSNVLILAGSETTATLLSGATFWILKNPTVYSRLVREVRTKFTQEADITLLTVNYQEYLIAVLNEALRMYPPIPTGLPRIVPQGGVFIDGYHISEKTAVSVSHWSAYHSPRNFHLPDDFIPERWLDDPRFNLDDKEVLQPFSYGPRNCLGKNLAYAEMRIILTRVLWNFDLELMPESEDWNRQQVFTFWEKGALQVKLTPVVRNN